MAPTSIDSLPEELQLYIFEFLDSPAPSVLNARQEPSLQLTRAALHPLKDIACVSKRWRRIVLPLLFRDACLRLDIPPRSEWSSCSACCELLFRKTPESEATLLSVEPYHADIMDLINGDFLHEDIILHHRDPEDGKGAHAFATATWAARIYHVVQDFLDFVLAMDLIPSIQSLILMSDRMVSGKMGRFLHDTADFEWRYPAAAACWQHLLSILDPDRVAIIAPPTELACLANAALDTFGDWAFTDMDFHILELQQDPTREQRRTPVVEYSKLKPFPPRNPSFADSSLIHLRQWTYCSLNEGSFLKAYGTYEYFERGPPSLVYSIKQCLLPKRYRGMAETAGVYGLPELRSFTYTAIFPFANHADFVVMLPHLEEIDLQFAPDPQSGILDDKERTGRAELQDCWLELASAYHDLATSLSSFRMSELRFPNMRKFTCRDKQVVALQMELDEIFTPLCLPVWVEHEHGFFTREAMSIPLPDDGT